MKRLSGHPLMSLVSGFVRPSWMLGGLVLQPLCVVAITLAATHSGAAQVGIIGAATLFGWWLWTAALCSLLTARRHYRELRLPAPPARLHGALWALLLVVNFLGPALALVYAAPDAAAAAPAIAVLACAQMAVPTFILMPFWMTGLAILVWLTSGTWAPLLSAIDGLPLMALAAVAMAAGVAWQGRRFVRGSPRPGLGSSVLEVQMRFGRAAGADTIFAADPGRSARLLAWLMPFARSRASDPPARRIALLLGPPFTPGSTRGQLAVLLGGGALIAAAVLVFGLGGFVRSFDSATLPWLCLGPLWSIEAVFPQRLATLFRRDRPELTEIALLPGLGGPARHAQALAGVVAWRSLQAYAAFIGTGMLALAWWVPAQWALPLSALAGLALLWLDAAWHLRRGSGLLPNAGTAMLVHLVAVAVPLGLLAIGQRTVTLAVLLALAAALLFAALRLRAAGRA